MKIHFAESQYKIDPRFRQKYLFEVNESYNTAAALLPFGSKHLNFFVQPREYDLMQETLDNGRVYNSEFIELAFNPLASAEQRKVIIADIKPTVFHEMNHAARYNLSIFHTTLLDICILEGLATVFERDYAATLQPYAMYPTDVQDWVAEVIAQKDQFSWQDYKFEHPDGRRWICYKAGTYIVDQAMANSGKTVIELTKLPCDEIIALAKIA